MATLPPPGVKLFPIASPEKKVYSFVDSLSEYLPIMNDRNRLSYFLLKYVAGEGDNPEVSVRTAKLKIAGISEDELIVRVRQGLQQILK